MEFLRRNGRFCRVVLFSLIYTLLWFLSFVKANEVLVNRRESVRFNCTTDPGSSVDWQYQRTSESSRVDIFIGNAKGGGGQKGNRYISETRYHIHIDIPSGRYDLLIDNVSKADQGLYSCSDVSNPESTTTTKLTVLGREEENFCSNDVANVVGDVVNLTFPTSKKDSIQLEHRSIDRSYPVHVFRDGRLVNDYYVLSGRFSFSASKNSWNLIINNVQTSDAGTYICSEDNGLGKQYTKELVVVDANEVVCSSDAEECNQKMNITCSANYSGHCPPHLKLTLQGNNQPRDEIQFTIAKNTVSLTAVVNWTNAPLCGIATQHYFINSTCRSPDHSICKETNMLVASNTNRIVVGAVVGIATFLIAIAIIFFYRQKIKRMFSNWPHQPEFLRPPLNDLTTYELRQNRGPAPDSTGEPLPEEEVEEEEEYIQARKQYNTCGERNNAAISKYSRTISVKI